MRHRFRLPGLVLLHGSLLAALGACGPKIHSFDVSPVVACQGEPIALDWDVRGDPRIEVRLDPATGSPAGDPAGAEGPAADTLTVLLAVEKGGRQADPREVAVLLQPRRFWREVVFTSDRMEGDTIWAVGAVGEKWSAFEVREVATPSGHSGHELHLVHRGRSVTLPADGSPSSAMAGLPLAGPWAIRSVGHDTPVDRLRFRALVTCTPGAP